MTLRPAHPRDTAALTRLKLATFRETFIDGFAIPYPTDELALFEEASYAPAVVAAELADADRATWIAEGGGHMLGYAQVGPCKLPHADVRRGAGELYQLYILNEAKGRGLGRRLLGEALAHLSRYHPGPVWLGVWSGNLSAQAFYAAHGFAKVGDYRFQVGRRWFDDEFIFRRG